MRATPSRTGRISISPPFMTPLPPQQGTAVRELFDIPDSITYLNCAYLSPDLRSVTAAGRKALERTAQPWTITAPDFFSTVEEVRDLVAGILGGDADGVALVPSVSYG